MKKLLCTLIALVLVCSVAFAELSIADIAAEYDRMLTGKWKCISGEDSYAGAKAPHDAEGMFNYPIFGYELTASLDGKAYIMWGVLGTYRWRAEISVSGDGKYLCLYNDIEDSIAVYERVEN